MTQKPTERQLDYLVSLNERLGNLNPIEPKTKEKASELITQLKNTIDRNIRLCGYANPRYYVNKGGEGWDTYGSSFD